MWTYCVHILKVKCACLLVCDKLAVVMGRKKRKPGSAAPAKCEPSSTEPWPNALSDWELAKNSGNSLYGQSKYDEALEQYMRAIAFLELETSEEGL